MKILVLGAGAVGSTIGGMLAQAGHTVALVGRNPHMSRIAASGLKITGLWGEYHVKTLQAATEIPAIEPDWILLTTKAYDTPAAAKVLHQKFPKNIPILHLQNGIGNAEILAGELGWPRVISGMIIIGFQIPLAGRTVVTVSADKIKIGRVDGTLDAPVKDIVKIFNEAHMPAEAVNDIQKQLWGKVLYNASLNALAGILGVKYGELLEIHPWAIIQRIIQEAFVVLKAENQPLAWSTAEAYLEHLRIVQVPATFDHKPSMLADLHHGRRTEIDFINGALAALGRKHQLPTPVNDTVIGMIHALEANGQKGILHPSLQPTDDTSA
jgi:2-dehydropantoate 2-reductase